MKLSSLERQLLRYAGSSDKDVATVTGYSVDTVRAARARLGKDDHGHPIGTPAPTSPRGEDIDRIMRTNRSVCG